MEEVERQMGTVWKGKSLVMELRDISNRETRKTVVSP